MTDLTTTPTTLDLDALAEIAKAATDGPWTAERLSNSLAWWVSCDEWGAMFNTGYVGNGDSKPNATHIATFDPPTVLALIARAEAAEANHRKAERKANDLFDEGIRQKNRAIAAEALVVERDKELMQIKGPCRAPGCMLHRAHNGSCNIGSLARDGA